MRPNVRPESEEVSESYPEDPVSPFYQDPGGTYCPSYNEVACLSREQALRACVAGVLWLARPEELPAIIQELSAR
jgi:hypothetical protein